MDQPTEAYLDFAGPDGPSKERPFLQWSDHYYVGDHNITEALGEPLGSRLADLLDIATYAYVSDRLTRRPRGLATDPYGLSWSRRFQISLPVRDIDFWQTHEVASDISELLHWLTDDEWVLEWAPSPLPPRPAELQLPLFPGIKHPHSVALFSAGLDSLLGAVRHLQDSDAPSLFLSIGTNPRMRAGQRKLATALRVRWPQTQSLVIPLNLGQRTDPDHHEPTQRSRGFLFLASGAAVAIATNLSNLHVFENGVGAINLPYTESQEGAHSSRAMHPWTLALCSRLLSMIAGRSFRITNDNLLSTKGAACRALPSWGHELVPLAVSCDHGFSHRSSSNHLCGFCTSCLLRRQSLWAAGLGLIDRADTYRFDALAPRREGDPRHFYLEAMLTQAAIIRECLETQAPWNTLVHGFPMILKALEGLVQIGYSAQKARVGILSLMKNYVQEWQAFPSPLVPAFLPSTPHPDPAPAWAEEDIVDG